MVDWIELGKAVGGGLLLILGGGVAGAVAGARVQGHTDRRLERDRRHERAGDVLGDVAGFLDDIEPRRLAFRQRPSHEVVEPAMERHDAIHVQLLRHAAGHPSADLLHLARDLVEAIKNSLITTGSWIDAREAMFEERDEAKVLALKAHERAWQLYYMLRDAI